MKIIHADTELLKRNLPHLERRGASYFIMWRLAGTIPSELLNKLIFQTQTLRGRAQDTTNDLEKRKQATDERKRLFAQFDRYLDSGTTGPKWLADSRMAEIVCNGIKDQTAFASIDCFTVMPNHVHILFTPVDPRTPREVMKRIKQISAFHCLKISRSMPPFWEGESYDHIVRENEWARILMYIIQNPVAAGLCKHWREWPYLFWRKNFQGCRNKTT